MDHNASVSELKIFVKWHYLYYLFIYIIIYLFDFQRGIYMVQQGLKPPLIDSYEKSCHLFILM